MATNLKLIIPAYFLFALPLALLSQRQKDLSTTPLIVDSIRDFRIKIDGGCGFYKVDSSGTSQSAFVFIISARKMAFFSLKGEQDYVYVNQQSRRQLTGGDYEEIFSGHGFIVKLRTHAVEKQNPTKRWGTLQVRNKAGRTTIRVKGTIEYKI